MVDGKENIGQEFRAFPWFRWGFIASSGSGALAGDGNAFEGVVDRLGPANELSYPSWIT